MVKINLFDQTLKIIGRNYAASLLRLALPGVQARLLGTLENVELSLPVRPVDFLHRIECEGQECILHIEFQLEHEADFPRRMHSYHGALSEQFKIPVLSVALYLSPRLSELPAEYLVRVGGQVVHRFTYPVVRLWDYVDRIRSGEYRELAPLLITLIDRPDEAILREERELILAEPDPRKRGDSLALAVMVASRYFDKAFLWRFFQEEVRQMREGTFIEDWLEEMLEQGLQQGLQRGRLEGATQAHRETILQILTTRFNPSPEQIKALAKKLEAIGELDVLRELVTHALRDCTFTDFNLSLTRLLETAPADEEQQADNQQV